MIKFFCQLLFLGTFLTISGISNAQTVSCRLTDQTGQPIPYASVHFPDMKRGVLTEADGMFSLNLDGGNANSEILFSCLNFVPTTLTVGLLRAQGGSACVISLQNADYQLQTTEVTASRINLKRRTIGVTEGTNNAWFDLRRTETPLEIGTIMKVRERCRIDNVNVEIEEIETDSFLIEVSLYDYSSRKDAVGKMLLRERIIRTLTQADSKSIYTIDLSEQSIWVDKNFLVAFRMIPTGKARGNVKMAARTKTGQGLITLGDGHWKDSYIYPTIWSEVSCLEK